MIETQALLTTAARRVRPLVLVPLVGGNLLLLLVGASALLIPDSHVWQLLLSGCVSLGLAAGLLVWNAVAIRRLRSPIQLAPLWLGALLLALWLALAAWLAHLIGFAEPGIETRAGFWNAELPHGLRYVLPFTRLVRLQEVALMALRWVVLPALVIPFAMETASTGLHASALWRALRVLFTARHWITAMLTLGIAALAVPVLAMWHPAHAVTGEVVSAAVRLALASLLIVLAAVSVLAVDAELLHRADRSQAPSVDPGTRASSRADAA